MTFSKATIKHYLLIVLALVYIFLATSNFGRASEDHYVPEEGVTGTNLPDHIFLQALECFNDKYIYKSCEETQRLTQSGDLNVPPEYTDEYCNGPCLTETHHVINCIDGIFNHFVFYNRATLNDVRETIDIGCGYGPKRGDFNVAEHIQSETDGATSIKIMSSVVFYAFVVVMMGWRVLF